MTNLKNKFAGAGFVSRQNNINWQILDKKLCSVNFCKSGMFMSSNHKIFQENKLNNMFGSSSNGKCIEKPVNRILTALFL